MAADSGSVEVVNILIASGAAVDQADAQGRTPLFVATGPKCAYALLRAGANVSARDNNGASPLHASACHGHIDVIEVFPQEHMLMSTLKIMRTVPL